ncbi:hypothetical protein [Candidatus Sulfurimonas baltica]|uniref:Uncharacterized protein n=1 Tax=Candidatus Sulfurimonas baltica TaxID=2740404 RepID=A0A7S7LW42_9BACT|nr:hypothetical protein [Candidatus Sulfurimonas baltica]QOY52475.1 hypothetical protein HUE88_01905 [Candidatus Sulfurimonas baltica]
MVPTLPTINVYVIVDEDVVSFEISSSLPELICDVLLSNINTKNNISRNDFEIFINNYYGKLAQALKINICVEVRYGNLLYAGLQFPPTLLISRSAQQLDLHSYEISEDFSTSTIGLILNPKGYLTHKGLKAKISNFSTSEIELYKMLDLYSLKLLHIVHSNKGRYLRNSINNQDYLADIF